MIQQNEIAANKQTLLSGKNNSIEKRVIDIDKAILVSDLHLGYEKCNVVAFTDFLEDCISNGTSKEYSLFILGDLWDLWRKHHLLERV